jgi:glycosyltransferase involved in cell wall biosynthesis
MRITFVLPTVGLAGGNRVIAIYAQALMHLGHTVRIISPPPQPIPLRRSLKLWILGNSDLHVRRPLMSHFDGTELDHHILDRWRPVTDADVPDGDVVIATWWETAEWVNALSPNKGAKVYFIQHHEIFSYLPVERCEATYRMPLHKVVVARWLQQIMSNRYGDQIVDLVPNSVDRTQFFAAERCKQSTPTVGLLYSTSAFKGLDVSLSALEIVREQFPDLRIIAFGSQQHSRALTLPSSANFFFCPPQDQIRNLYSRCDAWITASRSEGFNLPAMEAMACRTPVVSTRTGWPEEAVKSGINGILVNIDDHIGLAKGTKWILSRSDEDWRRLSANAYATVASSSWKVSVEKFESALTKACRRSARGEIAGRCAYLSEERVTQTIKSYEISLRNSEMFQITEGG